MKKKLLVMLLALVMLFVFSLSVSAVNKNDSITGATRTGGTVVGGGMVNESTATNTIITAGNITLFNLNTTARTVKWSFLMGNVTGEVQLVGTSGGSRIRTFGKAVPISQIKAVFVTRNPTFKFGSLQALSAKALDYNISTTSSSTWKANHTDSANATFNDTRGQSVNISHVLARSLTNLTGYKKSGTRCLKNVTDKQDTSRYNWQVGLFSSGPVITNGPNQIALGSLVQSQCDFRNQSVNFYLMYPLANGALGKVHSVYIFEDIE